MKLDEDRLVFSSGKRIYAYGGVIGLTPDLVPKGGFDDHFPPVEGDEDEEDGSYLTHDECVELADYMLVQWTRFKEKHTRA